MFIELGLVSICASSVGLYYCIFNKYITSEDVDNCLNNVDRAFGKLEENLNDLVTECEIRVNTLMNKMVKNIEKENYDSDSEDLELGECTRLLRVKEELIHKKIASHREDEQSRLPIEKSIQPEIPNKPVKRKRGRPKKSKKSKSKKSKSKKSKEITVRVNRKPRKSRKKKNNDDDDFIFNFSLRNLM